MVGMSGSLADRFEPLTAIARSLPDWTRGRLAIMFAS